MRDHRIERSLEPGVLRSRAVRRLVRLAVVVGVAIGLTGFLPGSGSALAAETPLTSVQPFATWDIDGHAHTLEEFLGRKPLLLEFMSPDCPHCQDMAPILLRLYAEYGKRIQFLTVGFHRDVARIQSFARLEKHPWPYLVGNQSIADAYRLEGVPTFFLATKDGRIVKSQVGSTSYEAMRQLLEDLLAAP